MSFDLVMQHTTLTPQPKQTYANKHYVMIWIFTYLKTKTIPMEELLKVHTELLLTNQKHIILVHFLSSCLLIYNLWMPNFASLLLRP